MFTHVMTDVYLRSNKCQVRDSVVNVVIIHSLPIRL